MYYFDFAATTPVDPRVADEMDLWLRGNCCNASSLYSSGKEAGMAVKTARERVAALVDAEPDNIIFTSGGTEADNTALISAALWGRKQGRNRIVVSAIEHHAILETVEFLESLGISVTVLPTDGEGRISADKLRSFLSDDVALVSVMWVNNEIGTVQDIPALAAVSHEFGALFHTDAVQALPTQNVSLKAGGADMISVSSHKIYGPKGCGALIIRNGLPFYPFMHGGQQESGRRGGTENVACIAGFGKAAELLKKVRGENVSEMARHREQMIMKFKDAGARINSPADGSPSILNIAFKDVEAEGMLFFLNMEDICVSMGSACNSKSVEPSHVIRAIAVPEEYARGCLRLSFGHGQTDEECLFVAEKIIELAQRMKA